ncbi:MAG TPA: VWA domain-containing protein [Candidatus Acidoferrales bacterium]|jgi:VWFA-related protein|nr:VWA domain-containing protein [Candidatus Acidoferrales bacterium]
MVLQAIILGIFAVAIALAPVGKEALAGAPAKQQGQQQQQQQGQQQTPPSSAQITVAANLVTIDAVVTDSEGNFLMNLKKENFRILEDNKPQIIASFSPSSEAPITAVILMQFSANMFSYNFSAMVARAWAPEFLRNLKKNDWIALMDFDLKTRVDVDFTRDPDDVLRELMRMTVPLYSESCIFDAVLETLDRLEDVHGKKAIVLIATGRDTLSKHTLDDTLKKVRQSDVAIYGICINQFIDNMTMRVGGINEAQAWNQLRTFSEYTGGQAWNPQMTQEVPGVMKQIAFCLRNQYSLGYNPPASSFDGKYHKIKVEIVNADGSPYVLADAKGKKQKFVVYARQGYTAKTASAAADFGGGKFAREVSRTH